MSGDYQDPESFYGYSVGAERDSVSEYRYGVWQFIDAETLNWQPYTDDTLYVATHDVPLGIVLSNVKYPEQYVERIEPGQKILRDSSYRNNVVYSKLIEGKGRIP